MVSIPEALDSGLRIIRDGLKAIVGEVIHSSQESGKSLYEEINEWREANNRRPLNPDPGRWGPDTILSVMVNNFGPFELQFLASFDEDDKRRAPYIIRGWLNDLIVLRNKSEHQGAFGAGDADDFVRIAERLLITAGVAEATELADLRKKLSKSEYDTPTVPATKTRMGSELVSQRPQVIKIRRIRRSEEPDFKQFLELMHKEFRDPNIRDPDEDLERWLDEAEIFKRQDPPCEDIFLVARHNDYDNMVVGLAYASYFRTLGFLFISYLAVDRSFAQAVWNRGEYKQAIAINREASLKLLKRLEAITNHNVDVVTEIATDDVKHNTELKRLFRGYANAFGERLYKIGAEYLQPALDPVNIQHLLSQDLLYMPGPINRQSIKANKGQLPRDRALDIVRFVYDYVYAGNFDRTETGGMYRTHVEDTSRLVCDGLPEPVPLLSL